MHLDLPKTGGQQEEHCLPPPPHAVTVDSAAEDTSDAESFISSSDEDTSETASIPSATSDTSSEASGSSGQTVAFVTYKGEVYYTQPYQTPDAQAIPLIPPPSTVEVYGVEAAQIYGGLLGNSHQQMYGGPSSSRAGPSHAYPSTSMYGLPSSSGAGSSKVSSAPIFGPSSSGAGPSQVSSAPIFGASSNEAGPSQVSSAPIFGPSSSGAGPLQVPQMHGMAALKVIPHPPPFEIYGVKIARSPPPGAIFSGPNNYFPKSRYWPDDSNQAHHNWSWPPYTGTVPNVPQPYNQTSSDLHNSINIVERDPPAKKLLPLEDDEEKPYVRPIGPLTAEEINEKTEELVMSMIAPFL